MRLMNIFVMSTLALTGFSVGVPLVSAECDNYGQVYQVGVGNEYNCQVQHCEQTTGLGAAAASASGTQSGKAGAQGSVGTRCTQNGSGGGNGTEDPPAISPDIIWYLLSQA